ncbi:hypothetical protein [Desulfatibacillum aliphaticivorans]|nr:hypothetical protein [Desulfatibacillum aliphaticivorans]
MIFAQGCATTAPKCLYGDFPVAKLELYELTDGKLDDIPNRNATFHLTSGMTCQLVLSLDNEVLDSVDENAYITARMGHENFVLKRSTKSEFISEPIVVNSIGSRIDREELAVYCGKKNPAPISLRHAPRVILDTTLPSSPKIDKGPKWSLDGKSFTVSYQLSPMPGLGQTIYQISQVSAGETVVSEPVTLPPATDGQTKVLTKTFTVTPDLSGDSESLQFYVWGYEDRNETETTKTPLDVPRRFEPVEEAVKAMHEHVLKVIAEKDLAPKSVLYFPATLAAPATFANSDAETCLAMEGLLIDLLAARMGKPRHTILRQNWFQIRNKDRVSRKGGEELLTLIVGAEERNGKIIAELNLWGDEGNHLDYIEKSIASVEYSQEGFEALREQLHEDPAMEKDFVPRGLVRSPFLTQDEFVENLLFELRQRMDTFGRPENARVQLSPEIVGGFDPGKAEQILQHIKLGFSNVPGLRVLESYYNPGQGIFDDDGKPSDTTERLRGFSDAELEERGIRPADIKIQVRIENYSKGLTRICLQGVWKATQADFKGCYVKALFGYSYCWRGCEDPPRVKIQSSVDGLASPQDSAFVKGRLEREAADLAGDMGFQVVDKNETHVLKIHADMSDDLAGCKSPAWPMEVSLSFYPDKMNGFGDPVISDSLSGDHRIFGNTLSIAMSGQHGDQFAKRIWQPLSSQFVSKVKEKYPACNN